MQRTITRFYDPLV